MSDAHEPDPLAPLFGDRAVLDCLRPSARLQAMLDVEAALAEVEARLGIIPHAAAAPVRAAAEASLYDLDALGSEAAEDGNLAIPLVRHLTREVARRDADAAGYVHWGATSQDILDTAMVVTLQKAIPPILSCLGRASAAAGVQARRHLDTIMPGRTWLQHATPITFGLKAAGWMDAIERQRAAVAGALEDARVVQFGGASGTLAFLGDAGPRVAEALADALGLGMPDLPWHAHRDRLARLACALGVACGVCGKIARDLALLAQTEVGEATETRAHGGGSSTMPHKRNPVSASVALSAAVRAPGLVATMLAAMPQEHERGLGGWQAEWTALPELVVVTSGAARAIAEALEGMSVDADRMRANLDSSGGVAMAEAVVVALAPHLGRREAHQRVEAAARSALGSGGRLLDALLSDPVVMQHLSASGLRARLDPAAYLGAARTLVERVLARWEPGGR